MRSVVALVLFSVAGLVTVRPCWADQNPYGAETHTVTDLHRSYQSLLSDRMESIRDVRLKWQSLLTDLALVNSLLVNLPRVEEPSIGSGFFEKMITDSARVRGEFSVWSEQVSTQLRLVESRIIEMDRVVLGLEAASRDCVSLFRAHVESSAAVRGYVFRIRRRLKTLSGEISFRKEVSEKYYHLLVDEKRNQSDQNVLDRVRSDLIFRNRSFFFRDLISRLETKIDFQLSVARNTQKAENLKNGLHWLGTYAVPMMRESAGTDEQRSAVKLLEADLENTFKRISVLSQVTPTDSKKSAIDFSGMEGTLSAQSADSQFACSVLKDRSRVYLLPFMGFNRPKGAPLVFIQERNGVSVRDVRIPVKEGQELELNEVLKFALGLSHFQSPEDRSLSDLLEMIESVIDEERKAGRSDGSEWTGLLSFKESVRVIKEYHDQALAGLVREAHELRSATEEAHRSSWKMAGYLGEHTYSLSDEFLKAVTQVDESEVRSKRDALANAARDTAFGTAPPTLRDFLLFGSHFLEGMTDSKGSLKPIEDGLLGVAAIVDMLDLSGIKGRSIRELAVELRLGKVERDKVLERFRNLAG